jgi:catechol 2,3-dioxygenase-like lactoylglutathione lyase family enzyme
VHRIFDHVDLRVANVEASRPFYDAFLSAVGFGETDVDDSGLLIYYRRIDGRIQEVVTLIESDALHQQCKTRIAFGAASREDVDRIAEVAFAAGATAVEAPAACPEYSATYYAAFFDDPDGNALEVVYR